MDIVHVWNCNEYVGQGRIANMVLHDKVTYKVTEFHIFLTEGPYKGHYAISTNIVDENVFDTSWALTPQQYKHIFKKVA